MRYGIAIAAIASIVLVVAYRWGVIAISGGTVEREKNPGLFGAALVLDWLALIIGVAVAYFDR